LSGQLGSLTVQPGDEVAAGDAVGTVGTSEGGASLYFEIRNGTEIVDPAAWFGI
jgi:septal ring factor EnvC (AmiA/AmiB activator)